MDFVAGVSHELRTPLAVICSAGDNLADGVVTGAEQIRRYGGVVRGEGRRLSRIVEQILRYTSLDRKPVQFEPVDVADAVNAAIAANQPDLDAAAIQIEKRVAPDLPPVMAEKTSLAHCVSNLVNNAAKHAATGEWIGVTARLCDGGKAVQITVEDRGAGIAEADLPYVFDPFYRGRSAMVGQIRGLGLGLNLVKRIVEAHGGSVAVTSAPGAGALFAIRLPVAEERAI
jgi:signal transduction histidine kinase